MVAKCSQCLVQTVAFYKFVYNLLQLNVTMTTVQNVFIDHSLSGQVQMGSIMPLLMRIMRE